MTGRLVYVFSLARSGDAVVAGLLAKCRRAKGGGGGCLGALLQSLRSRGRKESDTMEQTGKCEEAFVMDDIAAQGSTKQK